MKIYTRTGDQGQTKLLSGRSVAKSDQRLNAYGTTDELNSHLGVCICELQTSKAASKTAADLILIQNELFNVGSLLACDDPSWLPRLPVVSPQSTQRLETLIDQMTAQLPPLKNFILPGGARAAAHLHVARTVCRRAEREFALLTDRGPELAEIGIYLNRLSDYLFTLARYVNQLEGHQDSEWKK